MSIVQFENVSRIYTSGDHELRALDRVSFTLDEGKFIVILGPSGAGKSTLLNLLGGLDSPSEGKITVNGKDISKLSVATCRDPDEKTQKPSPTETSNTLFPYLNAAFTVAQ
jgi:ABC-type lipoprotein export system ATPase subunit